MEYITSFRTSVQPVNTSARGFTLLEMLVVIFIILILSSTVLVSQSAFNKTIILANTAYDIGLSIRSAAAYGIGSRATTAGFSNAGYGIYFAANTPTQYLLFADTLPPASIPSACHPTPVLGTTA